jgi:Cupin superfamily protein
MTVALEAWALALGTLPESEGFRMLEAAEVRFFAGTDPARFQTLCSIGDLDAFLSSDSARPPRVALADSRREGNAGVPYDDYTAGGDGRVDLPRLLALHDAGATLVLSQMHEIHPPLGRFCRGLERIFLHAVQSNIYLTPPGAQGFRVHYDTHDVLILQVQGEKLWRFWPTPWVPFANARTPLEDQPSPSEQACSQTLRAGDVLFVPRGILHEAASQGGQSSLHLTIGILGQSWGDALRAALDVMERRDPRLRQLFPMWRLAEGSISDELMQEAARHLSALGTMSVMELISQQLLAKLAAEQMPMVSRGLIAPTVLPTDRLNLSDTVHHFVTPRPDGSAQLRWAGGNVTLSAREFGWIVRISDGASASDLGDSEALAFCQKLASDGLITVLPATKAAE